MEYVHRLILSGEVLPPEPPKATGPVLTEGDLMNIKCVSAREKHIHTVWNSKLYPALKLIDSKLAIELYCSFADLHGALSGLKRHIK